jgi:imidazolonepropionase-like amidohydrolase
VMTWNKKCLTKLNRMKKSILIFALSMVNYAYAQQKENIIFAGATIHIGNGELIENGTIHIKNGIIVAIDNEPSANATIDPTAIVVNAKGKHIYPGLIAPYSRLGLEEVEAVRATLDYREVGELNPNVRALISYNTDSKLIPTVRSNGVLTAMTVPEGGIVTGSSSLMKLAGWNWEDAVYKADVGIHLNWPSMRIYSASWAPSAEDQKSNTEKSYNELRNLFNQAKAYNEINPPLVKNLKFAAMQDLFSGKKKLFIAADYSKDIIAAVNFSKEYGITPIIVGARDAHLVLNFLKENNIAIILENAHSLPSREDDDIDLPYKKAAILYSAGIKYCMAINGSWQQRNLPFEAGTTAAYGVPREMALRSVSLSAAEILGVAANLGSLTKGKDATLLISTGDLLDMKSSIVERAWIQGTEIKLKNSQNELNEKYLKKYGIDQ